MEKMWVPFRPARVTAVTEQQKKFAIGQLKANVTGLMPISLGIY
jgi:hypothetical protein